MNATHTTRASKQSVTIDSIGEYAELIRTVWDIRTEVIEGKTEVVGTVKYKGFNTVVRGPHLFKDRYIWTDKLAFIRRGHF
jgi:hypothetical protein